MPTYNSLTDRDDASALIPEEVAGEIFGHIAETSAVAKLARQLPTVSRKQQRIRVWDMLPFAYFVNGDTGLKQTTKVAWRNVFMNMEEIATIVPIPENVLADAETPIFDRALPYIEEAIGVLFDRAVIHGENAPATWPDSIVEGAVSAGQIVNVGESGGDLYDDLLGEDGVLAQVEEDGFMVTGHLAAMSMKAKLRSLRGTDDHPIFVQNLQGPTTYALDGEPLAFPRNGALTGSDDALMVSGDWSQLVWAPRQDITYKVLSEAVINDADGNIIYNLAQQDMVALRVVFRAGWALPNPINRMNADDDTRYPFSVYATATGVTS